MLRRLAAVIVIDVVGYTRLMAADEAGTLESLKFRRKTVLEPVVRIYSGRIVKFMGDGALMEFASAVNAVNCAIVLQQKMEEANGDLPEPRRIVLRIGINIGEVIGDGTDIYGSGVNIAARLEAQASPGGICMSEKVYDEVRGKIDSDINDLGLLQLKNIEVPIHAYGIRMATASISDSKIGRTAFKDDVTSIVVRNYPPLR